MAPNPRVGKAFRAMKEIGISEGVVKPVLKNLLKLYEKNWELIEEENYRALADAIFEYEETKTAEVEQNQVSRAEGNYLREEEQVNDEPERPLKRLRLRHQEDHPAIYPCDNTIGETSLITPKLEGEELPDSFSLEPQELTSYDSNNISNIREVPWLESSSTDLRLRRKQPISPKALEANGKLCLPDTCASEGTFPEASQIIVGNSLLSHTGKQPLSPHSSREGRTLIERSPIEMCLKEPDIEPGISSISKKLTDAQTLIKPKDEPVTDEIPDTTQFEIPIAVVPPDPLPLSNFSIDEESMEEPHVSRALISLSAANTINNFVPAASSGERLKANHDPAAAVGESSQNVEIASSTSGEVKISFSFNSSELGTISEYESQEPHQLKILSGEEDTSNAKDVGISCSPLSPSNTSVNFVLVTPEFHKLSPSANALDYQILHDDDGVENDCGECDKEKEGNNYKCGKSCSLVVAKQNQLTPDEIRSLYDVNDITKGQERVKITLVNEVNNASPPSFHYIPRNLVFQNAYVNFALARIGDEDCCSTCFGDCLSSKIPCACAHETGGEYAYTSDGLVKEELLEECISMNRDPEKHCHVYCKECPLERPKHDEMPEPCKGHLVRKFIKECWSKCGCSRQCGNRLVQRGISRKLQVFMTPEGKGWGLRTLEDLPKGAFVCEYVGEILTNAELDDRNSRNTSNHAYPVLLDADWSSERVLKDEEALCLDATHYGNVARFINHRCFDSTMVEIPVQVEAPDHHYYHLAFFTTRKVAAMEELTWDYGIDFDDHGHPVKAFRCRCGSKYCRNMKRSKRRRGPRW